MKIGLPKESDQHERRVALTPQSVGQLVPLGVKVVVERGAGAGADFTDQAYEEAGGEITDDRLAVWNADIVTKVVAPTTEEVNVLHSGSVLIGFLSPLTAGAPTKELADQGVTSFAFEALPRITRAQPLDALSSQSTVAGYQAALIAARTSGRFFPMLMTAAGTIPPAKVIVLGAGVAGLQALATARRLGGVVSAYDVRPAVSEQIESLGGKFLRLQEDLEAEGGGGYAKQLDEDAQQRQREQLAQALAEFNVVITTALIPGKPAPLLVTKSAVEGMEPGTVVVDLAGESGGNCELSQYGQNIIHQGVTIVAPKNLASEMPQHASQLYANNMTALLKLIIEEGQLKLDFSDEIIAGMCITHEGKIVHEGARALVGERN